MPLSWPARRNGVVSLQVFTEAKHLDATTRWNMERRDQPGGPGHRAAALDAIALAAMIGCNYLALAAHCPDEEESDRLLDTSTAWIDRSVRHAYLYRSETKGD